LLVLRAFGLVVRPRATWASIATDATPLARVIVAYALPLAILGPLATFAKLRLIGIPLAPRTTFRASSDDALREAALSFALGFAGPFLVAAIVNAFAPLFATPRGLGRALRVTTYAYAPLWLAGPLVLVPSLGVLQLAAAAYAVLLLGFGLRTVLGTPARAAAAFAAVAVLAAVGGGFAFGIVGALLRSALAGGATP
jgi:hypothetical protein